MSLTQPESVPKRGLIRRTFRNWWVPILAIWFVGSALIAGIVAGNKPLYRASALLRAHPLSMDLYGVRGNASLETHLQLQVQLITTPNVLSAAAKDPKAIALPRIQSSPDAVSELRQIIGVGVIPGTSLLEVSIISESPTEAAVLVNAVVDSFLASNNDWAEVATRRQRESLEDYLAKLKQQSDEVSHQWKKLLSRGGPDAGVFLKGQEKRAELSLEQFQRLHQDLFEANLELMIAQAWVSALKSEASNAAKNPASPADEALLGQRVEQKFKQDPQVAELAARMMEAKVRLDEIRKTVRTADDPSEKEMAKKLKDIESDYDRSWQVRSRQILDEIAANKPNPEGELLEAEAKVRALGVRCAILKGQLDQLEVRDLRQPADEVDLVLIREKHESLRAMEEVVVRRLEQLNFESRDGKARIDLFNRAMPPGRPIRDSRISMIFLGLIVMLPISFAFFLGVEAIRGSRVPGSNDLAKGNLIAEV